MIGTEASTLAARLRPDAFPRTAGLEDQRGFDRDAFAKAATAAHVLPDQVDAIVTGPMADLLDGACACSPFLFGLISQDPQRLARVALTAPNLAFNDLLERLRDAQAAMAPDRAGLNELMKAARAAKAEAALLIALADLGGIWSVQQVTRAISRFADTAVQVGVRALFRIAAAKGDWQTDRPDAPEFASGYAVLGMGKHGACELNYSSDIDLIVVYDRERHCVSGNAEPHQFFVKLTQELVRFLQQRTADGYVFRTDLRLRPDPGATQVAVAMDAAAVYYESVGQNWERAAMIKARPVAGDLEAGRDFLDGLRPFIWRKYLDFAAIADIHAMKRQIHAHKGFGAITVAGHNVKLGRGGIREIEFFAQTQQLIAAGRQPELQTPETVEALARLAHRGWITEQAADELTADYRALRIIEHRLQMIADEQTQQVPSSDEGLARLAAFCGDPSAEAFAKRLTGHLTRVHGHYAALFERNGIGGAGDQVKAGDADNLVFFGEDADPSTLAFLAERGFKQPGRTVEIIRSWHRGRYRALATKRAREALTDLHGALIEAFAKTVDPDAAVIGFDRLLEQLPAGVQFFALLEANANLLRLIADIVGSAPRLAQTLARRRSVIDALVDPRIIGESLPSRRAVDALVATQFVEADTYEDLLDRARVIGAEQQFLIGVRVLAGSVGADDAGRAYADLAEALISALHNATRHEFIRQTGAIGGRGSAVIAMGKLGSSEMTAASDLDLIVIYDAPAHVKESAGPRPLSPTQYYSRFTQRLIAALTAPTSEGTLYPVDMRLRPSGQKGPVATRLDGFGPYQLNDAWTWEHMALTRARVVAGPDDLREEIEQTICDVLTQPRDRSTTAGAVRDMRERVWKEKGGGLWDLKQARGGLVELEFLTQFLQLVHAAETPAILDTNTEAALRKLNNAGLLAGHGEALVDASRFFHALTQVLRLCFDGPFMQERAPEGLKHFLAGVADEPNFSHLEARLADVQSDVSAAFTDLLG